MEQPPNKQRRFFRRLRAWSRRQKANSEKRRSEYLYLSGAKRWRRWLINLHPESLFSFFTSREGVWLVFKIAFGGLCLLTLLITFAYFHYRSEVPATVLELQSCLEARVIEFYDRQDQTLLWSLQEGDECRAVELDEISPHLVDALISIEDKDFFSHPGYKATSIARSAINNLLGRPLQGGSTITQQYIKNAILRDSGRSWERKIKEMVLVPEIESRYSKEDILIAYLNTIYLGSNYSGIEAASRGYFGKPAAELTLDESAYLVASINAPSAIWENPERHRQRRDLVLSEMLRDGKIKQTDYQQALKIETAAKLLPQDDLASKSDIEHAAYFVTEARRQLEQALCPSPDDCDSLQAANYRVVTSLNLAAQTVVERSLEETLDETADGFDNAALIVINNRTKEVLALAGGRDFQQPDFGQINNAVKPLAPGALWQPFIYASLMEDSSQWGPGRVLYDYPTFGLEGETEGAGPLSMRQALAESRLTPAAKAAYLSGYDRIGHLAESLGLTADSGCRKDCHLQQAQATGFKVRFDDLVNAYAALGSNGRYQQLGYIRKISDDQGRTIYQRPMASSQILSADTAFMINDILSDDKRRSKSLAGLEGLAFKAAIGSKRQSNPFVAYLPRLTLGGWIGQQIHDREAPPAEEVVAGQSLLVRKFFQNWSNDSLLDDRWSPPADLRRLQTNPRSGLIGSGSSDYYPAGFKSEHLPLPAIVAIDKASNSLATNCTPPTALKELMTSALVPELDADRTAYRRWMLPVWQNLGWRLDGRIPSEADTLHACGDKPPQISLQSQGNCRQQCRLTIKLLAGSHELWRVIVNDGDEALSYDISGRSAEIVHLQQGRPAAGRLTIEVWDQALYRRIHFFDPD